jgi:hypothetical protein
MQNCHAAHDQQKVSSGGFAPWRDFIKCFHCAAKMPGCIKVTEFLRQDIYLLLANI